MSEILRHSGTSPQNQALFLDDKKSHPPTTPAPEFLPSFFLAFPLSFFPSIFLFRSYLIARPSVYCPSCQSFILSQTNWLKMVNAPFQRMATRLHFNILIAPCFKRALSIVLRFAQTCFRGGEPERDPPLASK